MKIRTRYAPSPTGYFHIGGARTALFNYLFAKHHNGDFVFRVEDTDIERNVEKGIESQLDNLNWLGLEPDESLKNPKDCGPYQQSKKLDHYKKLAYKLVDEGKAYFCFCSKEELDAQREHALKNGLTPKYNRCCYKLTKAEIDKKLKENIPYTIRLKMPDNVNVEWEDLIRGHMSVPTSALTDPVILKSNGFPMYNFAVVVDDYDMKITHVLRGEEHISNTPYQICIKRALGYDKQNIEYGHLSIIVNSEGKKLSKRDSSLKQFIEDYKTSGYPSEAIVNFLALLGWSPENNQEIMNMDELIKAFDIDRVNKAPAFFDIKKMDWVANEYFKKMENDCFLKFIKPFINFNDSSLNDIDNLCISFKNNISKAVDLNDLIDNEFNHFDLSKLDKDTISFLNTDNCKKVILSLSSKLNKDINTTDEAKALIDEIKNELGVKGKELFMPIRIALSSHNHGIELFKLIYFLNKKERNLRVKQALELIK